MAGGEHIFCSPILFEKEREKEFKDATLDEIAQESKRFKAICFFVASR